MMNLRPSNLFLQPVATITLHFDQLHALRRHENKLQATEANYSAQKSNLMQNICENIEP